MDRLFLTSRQHWWEQVNNTVVEFHPSENKWIVPGANLDGPRGRQRRYRLCCFPAPLSVGETIVLYYIFIYLFIYSRYLYRNTHSVYTVLTCGPVNIDRIHKIRTTLYTIYTIQTY